MFTHINFEKKIRIQLSLRTSILRKPNIQLSLRTLILRKPNIQLRLRTSFLKKIRFTSCLRFRTLVRKRKVYGFRIRIPEYGTHPYFFVQMK